MTDSASRVFPLTVGLDVGDRKTHFCAVNAERKVIARGSFPTTRDDLSRTVAQFPGARMVL